MLHRTYHDRSGSKAAVTAVQQQWPVHLSQRTKGRRSWMMRALRILEVLMRRLSVSFATFRIICCPFLVFGAGAKPGAVEEAKTAVAELWRRPE
jgi:hypothetical protein